MRKRFFSILALILALAFPVAPAGAELIFTRQDNSYANTALGIVLGDGAPIHPLVSNMGGNQGQGIYPFVNADGNFRVAITLYTHPLSTATNESALITSNSILISPSQFASPGRQISPNLR